MGIHSLCIPLISDPTISSLITWFKETLALVGIAFQFSPSYFQFNKIPEASRDTFWNLKDQLWFAFQHDRKTANGFAISWCNVWAFGLLCFREASGPSYYEMFSNSNILLNIDKIAGFLTPAHVLLKIYFFNLHIWNSIYSNKTSMFGETGD